MDELKLRRDMERGEKARRLIDDPVMQEAFSAVDRQIYHMFTSAKLGDEASVRKAKDLEYALSLVKRALRDFVHNGELSAHIFENKSTGVLGKFWARER